MASIPANTQKVNPKFFYKEEDKKSNLCYNRSILT